FLSRYSSDFPEGAVLCRTRSALDIEEDLLVEIAFPGLANRTLLRGSVASIERGKAAWIRLHAGDAHTRDFVLAVARGEISPEDQVERGHRRIPAALPVTCRIDELDEPASDELVGHTHDVGGGGAFVPSVEPPAVGTRVSLLLGPVAHHTFALAGRVAWIRRDPRAHGFGVRFDPRGEHNRELRAMLRRAWERGRLELLPA